MNVAAFESQYPSVLLHDCLSSSWLKVCTQTGARPCPHDMTIQPVIAVAKSVSGLCTAADTLPDAWGSCPRMPATLTQTIQCVAKDAEQQKLNRRNVGVGKVGKFDSSKRFANRTAGRGGLGVQPLLREVQREANAQANAWTSTDVWGALGPLQQQRHGLQKLFGKAAGFLAAACVSLVFASGQAAALPGLSSMDVSREQYEKAVRQHTPKSNLPTQGEAEVMLQMPQELFTDDAWEGMKTILDVARFVDQHLEDEEAQGCETCADNRKTLEKAWQVVANEYFDPRGNFSQAAWAKQLLLALQRSDGVLRTRQETYAAVHDMVASLHDKYTEFLTPAEFRRALRRPHPAERDYLERQFTGVGLQLGNHSSRGGWLVEGPLAESPAEEGGILPGQRVVEIDGYPADLLSPLEIAALMRGPAGSSVLITLAENAAHGRLRTLDLERRALPQPPLKTAVLLGPHGPVQYIRVHYFSGEASRAFVAAVKEAEGASRRGILVDLRNNPGGVFEEAIWMASLLLERGADIAETVRNDDVIDTVFSAGLLPRQIFPTQLGTLTRLPVAIVINGGSASASEVFAGALQDNRRAVLVGERSFGKGVVQHYFPFPDGSGLKVTVAKYLTPGGRDISRGGGIPPDVSCSDYPHTGPVSAESDACIRAALESL